MDSELKELIDNVINSASDIGCTPDLTVIDAEALAELKQYMKHYELGS